MVVIFLSTVFAIGKGREISVSYSGNPSFVTSWPGLYGLFVFLALLLGSVGAVGYAILYALHQAAAQRFRNVRTWAERQ